MLHIPCVEFSDNVYLGQRAFSVVCTAYQKWESIDFVQIIMSICPHSRSVVLVVAWVKLIMFTLIHVS